MAITTRLRSIFQSGSSEGESDVTAVRSDASFGDKALFRDSDSGEADMEADKILEPGELSFDEDTRGGMGRHLGLTSTTFLM
jgi:solute carrier family 7 (L-type amino acid transporter), member 9/15